MARQEDISHHYACSWRSQQFCTLCHPCLARNSRCTSLFEYTTSELVPTLVLLRCQLLQSLAGRCWLSSVMPVLLWRCVSWTRSTRRICPCTQTRTLETHQHVSTLRRDDCGWMKIRYLSPTSAADMEAISRICSPHSTTALFPFLDRVLRQSRLKLPCPHLWGHSASNSVDEVKYAQHLTWLPCSATNLHQYLIRSFLQEVALVCRIYRDCRKPRALHYSTFNSSRRQQLRSHTWCDRSSKDECSKWEG